MVLKATARVFKAWDDLENAKEGSIQNRIYRYLCSHLIAYRGIPDLLLPQDSSFLYWNFCGLQGNLIHFLTLCMHSRVPVAETSGNVSKLLGHWPQL